MVVSYGSQPFPASSFLFKALLHGVVLESFLDLLALLAQFEWQLMLVVVLVQIVSKGVVARRGCTRLAILSLSVVLASPVMSLR